MPLTQSTLFEADVFESEQKTKDSYWELTKDGIREAADVLAQLLRREGCAYVMFEDIVRTKMGLVRDADGKEIVGVLRLAGVFAHQLEAISNSRHAIRDMVEADFQLQIVDADGRPAIRGGAPCGFALSHSASGIEGERIQARMTVAKLEHELARRKQLGGVSDDEHAAAVNSVRSAKVFLVGPSHDQVTLPVDHEE